MPLVDMSLLKQLASLDIDKEFAAVMQYDSHGEAVADDIEFDDVVRSRRSVRYYDTAKVVPEEVIDHCLDLAMLSPNSSNLQPWEFHWVRSPRKKAEMSKFCMSQPTARTASDFIVFVARTDTWWRNSRMMIEILERKDGVPQSAIDYYRLLTPIMYTQAGNILSIFKHLFFNIQGLIKPTPREPNFKTGMRLWATKSVCLAASTFMLAIRAHGYDTCAMEGCDQARIKKMLGLGRNAHVVMVVSVGAREEQGIYGERIRFDRSWFVKKV